MKMPPEVVAEKLKTALSLLEELGDEMNDDTKPCTCCGLALQKNRDDYQAKQAIDGAANRLVKLYEKLFDGTWIGREIAPVVDASAIRRGG